jgi:hypothetical protein
MNFYFVFEGKTEPVIYKKWLSVLLPELTEVNSFDSVQKNHYYYVSNMGYPDCFRTVAKAIQDINLYPFYDYLLLFIDADELSIEEKLNESNQKIAEHLALEPFKSLPINCHLKIIVQNVCIETWFLGNRKFFVRNPISELLRKYIDYYDVSINNPENLAEKFQQNEEGSNQIFGYSTKALFHESYLKEIFKERLGFSYHKSKPKEVQEAYFLEQLLARVSENPTHLLSFQDFVNFCSRVSNKS